MKNYSVLICIFFSFTASAQIKDLFTDGEFTSDPSWSGSAIQFTVNSALQLQLSATAAGTSWLSTSLGKFSLSTTGEWQTTVRQSFLPSAGNYGRVYLLSDEADLTKPLHGYFLQFGEGGSNDAIELFRQDGSVVVSVCRATNGAIATSFIVGVDVVYDRGRWSIAADYTGGNHFTTEATGIDSTYSAAPLTNFFFGVRCTYTTSNAAKFFYDNVYAGPLIKADTIPPVSANPPAKPKDIIITEILADPDPAIGLPDKEYIELFNRSDHALTLTGFQLADGGNSAIFPVKEIQPGKYVVVTAVASLPAFSAVVNAIGLTTFPSLGNTGDNVVLKDAHGLTIDSVNYSSAWYRSLDKANGGWSLELIDIHNPCGDEDNWIASENPKGGTPGLQNSVFADKPDVTGPRLLTIVATTDRKLLITFDEKLDSTTPLAGLFTIAPAVAFSNPHFTSAALRTIQLDMNESLAHGTRYFLTASNVRDCNGNLLQEEFNTIEFSLPEIADSLDIVINELLFNPRPSGVDFAEIYNRSEKYINLREWKLANFENGTIKDQTAIATDDLILSPHHYLVLTSDGVLVKNNYPSAIEQAFFITDLPSLPDDDGSIALINDRGDIVDYFLYFKGFHTKLLKDVEGVSLERISFIAPTDLAQNWRSASASAGYATPGYLNSCSRPENFISIGTVIVEPEIIIPETGAQDFAKIKYAFDVAGSVANVLIRDQLGRPIKTISNNETLGVDGFFRWDGDRDDGSKARMGYYVVWFEVFELTGGVRIFRKRVIVAAR